MVYDSEELAKPINSLLLNRTYFLDEDINSNENIISKNVNIGKLELQIEYINNQDKQNKIVIPLNVEEEYSNNKIFY